jgi:CBS domain-containing protein
MTDSQDNRNHEVQLHEVLRGLPLLDEVFLGMQAMNVDVVDAYLEELEAQLLQEYIERDRMPIQSALFLSALSQMWVFAVYELLRTWRQRIREVLRWAEELAALGDDEREVAVAAKRGEIERRASEARDAEVGWRVFDRADDAQFVEELWSASNRAELAFHDVEAVRMTLAKHEVPRQGGVYAGAPGYGRIDMSNGSIYWQVELGRNEVTVLSRRGIADALRTISRPNDRILPVAIRERVTRMERQSYGINRVAVVLDDGTEQRGVRVAWATEVVGVDGYDRLPFEVARIIDVRPDPSPEDEQDDAAPF